MLGYTPPAQCMLGYTPPLSSACWDTHPPASACLDTRPPPPGGHCSGRYTSYRNAFLLWNRFTLDETLCLLAPLFVTVAVLCYYTTVDFFHSSHLIIRVMKLDRSLKHELGSIQRSCLTHVSSCSWDVLGEFLVVFHRAGFHTSIVILWDKQSRRARICTQISKTSTPKW